MKAIQVRYLPVTKFQCARLKAFSEGNNSVTIQYDFSISSDSDRTLNVAQMLIEKMKWNVKISGIGQLPNGDWCVTIDGI